MNNWFVCKWQKLKIAADAEKDNDGQFKRATMWNGKMVSFILIKINRRIVLQYKANCAEIENFCWVCEIQWQNYMVKKISNVKLEKLFTWTFCKSKNWLLNGRQFSDIQ